MNSAILITILFALSQIAFAQKTPSIIDRATTDREVEKLIHSLDTNYNEFKLRPIAAFTPRQGSTSPCKVVADSLGITKAFYKADFDKNGYTDLLTIGNYYDFTILIVMHYGKDSFNLNRLTRSSFQDCTFPEIINDTIIRYYYYEQPDWRQKPRPITLQYKDLVFKFGDFVEYNPNPGSHKIEKIEFQTTACFGTCPVFFMSIANDKSAIFKAEEYNRPARNSKTIKGTYKTTLAENSFSEIIGLLNYIDFPNLKDNYEVNWTDDQTCTLTITYDNGQIKTIKDYGLIGTYGLDRVYKLLFDFRFNQDWK